MIEAIFFDNDGTLVDTEIHFFRATKTILEKLSIDLSRDWFIEYSLRQNKSAWDLLDPTIYKAGDIQEFRAERDALYSSYIKNDMELLPGVRETLKKLKGKVPMSVVTSSKRNHFEIIHEKTGILDLFDFIIVNEDVVNEKPDPEPYLLAVEKSGVPAEFCLAVEDTERGLISAKAAGIQCYVVPTDLTREHDFREADQVLSNFADLMTNV